MHIRVQANTKKLLKNLRKVEIREEVTASASPGPLLIVSQELLEEVRKELQKMKEEIIEGEAPLF